LLLLKKGAAGVGQPSENIANGINPYVVRRNQTNAFVVR
jgi:hypothetical protein